MKANALIRLALSAALAAAFCAAARAVSVSVSPSGTINSGQTVTIVGSEGSATAGSLTLEARLVSSGSWIAIGGGGPSYCSASYAFPVGGTWEVRCRFSGYLAGWPPPGTYYSGSATTTVNVTAPAPQVSSIAFTPPSGQVGYGTPVEAKAWLTTPFPSNGQVSFAIYSPSSSTTPAQVINVATNSNTASAVFAPSSAGIWTVRATGSGTYNGAPTSHSATASFQALAYISPSVTSLAAAAEVPAVNFPVTLTAAVSADYAADGAVVFEVKKSGAAQWTSVAVEPIGSNRQAVGRWIPDSAGSWSVRCRSQGRVLVSGALQFHVSNGYCNLAGGYYASGVSAANPYFAAVDEWNLTGKPAYWKDINGDGLRDKFQNEQMADVTSYTDWGAAWLPNPCCVSVIGWLFGSVSTDALCCGAILVPVANGAYNNYSVDVEIVEGHAQQLYMEFHNDSNGSRVGFVTEAAGPPGAVKRVVMPDVSVSLSWRKIALITLAKIVFDGNRNDSPHISEVAVQSVSGSNNDALLLDAEVEVLNATGTDLKIKVPSVVSLPSGVNVDWTDQRAYGNTSVWSLDLDGNGAIDTVLNPINASGRVSVPILGKLVEVTLDRDGVSVSIGKFQIGRDFDGALRVGLPASLAGSDGQIVLKIKPGTPAFIVPDYNRDGKIDQSDRGKASGSSPYSIWLNDDDDSGETSGTDIPGSTTGNASNLNVNGQRDLVDFFPLFLDIGGLYDEMPFSQYKYMLKQEDGALNFLEHKDIVPGNAPDAQQPGPGAHLTNASVANALKAQSVAQVTAQGVELKEVFLTSVDSGRGVIYVEGRKATQKPLVLEIVHRASGLSAFRLEFPIAVVGVESMYRHLNLLGTLGQSGGIASSTAEPVGWPDDERVDKFYVFVHGYNVNPEQARGWNAETFKRLYWSGFNAKFVGVYWYGYESQKQIFGEYKCPDFYENVINAFRSSLSFRTWMTHFPESKTAIGAHSLGNMLVSAAIQDHQAYNPAKFFMFNAAVPMEAYDGGRFGSELARMTHDNWDHLAGQNRVRASHWHMLFASSDKRRGLTWRDRFPEVTQAYNFYSIGENVLDNGEGNSPPALWDGLWEGNRTWYAQEWAKGGAFAVFTGDVHGGWGFNEWHIQAGQSVPLLSDALNAMDATLRVQPLFRRFQDDDPVYPGSNGYHGWQMMRPDLDSTAQSAYNYVTQSKLLAEAIPATSFAVGRNVVPKFALQGERNIDMQTSFQTGWPTDRDEVDWLHGDMKTVSYIHVHKLYKRIVELGGFQ